MCAVQSTLYQINAERIHVINLLPTVDLIIEVESRTIDDLASILIDWFRSS
jgi:hypothetical protein